MCVCVCVCVYKDYGNTILFDSKMLQIFSFVYF